MQAAAAVQTPATNQLVEPMQQKQAANTPVVPASATIHPGASSRHSPAAASTLKLRAIGEEAVSPRLGASALSRAVTPRQAKLERRTLMKPAAAVVLTPKAPLTAKVMIAPLSLPQHKQLAPVATSSAQCRPMCSCATCNTRNCAVKLFVPRLIHLMALQHARSLYQDLLVHCALLVTVAQYASACAVDGNAGTWWWAANIMSLLQIQASPKHSGWAMCAVVSAVALLLHGMDGLHAPLGTFPLLAAGLSGCLTHYRVGLCTSVPALVTTLAMACALLPEISSQVLPAGILPAWTPWLFLPAFIAAALADLGNSTKAKRLHPALQANRIIWDLSPHAALTAAEPVKPLAVIYSPTKESLTYRAITDLSLLYIIALPLP